MSQTAEIKAISSVFGLKLFFHIIHVLYAKSAYQEHSCAAT